MRGLKTEEVRRRSNGKDKLILRDSSNRFG